MSKAADADNADFVGRFDVILHNRVEDRDAAAEERSGFTGVKRVRQPDSPAPMTAHAVGKSSGSPDDCLLRLLAKVLIPAHTLRASHVAFGNPPEPDSIADFQVFHLIADGDDFADGFVSRYKRINSHLPFVVAHGQI